MKKLKIKLLKAYNATIVAVFGFFGIVSSCMPVAYGTPHATFELKGTVKSSTDNRPIGNIKVVLEEDTASTQEHPHIRYATIYTGNDGAYAHSQTIFPFGNQGRRLKIKYEDIDSTENGEFQSLDTVITIEPTDFNGKDGSRYAGKATKEINVSLRPKE